MAAPPAAWPAGWRPKRRIGVTVKNAPVEDQAKSSVVVAYVEAGDAGSDAGLTLVFLHGNPTSSYMWRNVMVRVAESEKALRLLAPDMAGMGDSQKLDFDDSKMSSDGGPSDPYSVERQYRYFEAFMDAVVVGGDSANKRVVLVVHSWGSVIGSWWAHEHPDLVCGLVVLECVFRPFPSWDVLPEALRAGFQKLHSVPAGEEMVLKNNFMVEVALPGGTVRKLAVDGHEMQEYRRPFVESEESRRPILSLVRSVPVGGEPSRVHEMMETVAAWLSSEEKEFESSSRPLVLFVNGDPGSSLTGEEREFVRSWPRLTEVTVPGKHLLTEDSPVEIGDAIVDWLQKLL